MMRFRLLLATCLLLLARSQSVTKEVKGSIKFKAMDAKALSTDATKTAAIKAEIVKFLGTPAEWLTTTFMAADSDANIEVMYKILVPKDNTDAALSAEKLKEKMTFTPSDASAKTLAAAVAKAISDDTVAVASNSTPTVEDMVMKKVMGTLKVKATNATTVAADKTKTDAVKAELVKFMGVTAGWVTTTFAAADSDANIEIKYTVLVPANNMDDKMSAETVKTKMTFGSSDAAATTIINALKTVLSDSTVAFVSAATPTTANAVAKKIKGSMKFKAADAKTVAANSTETSAMKAELVKFIGVPAAWVTTMFGAADSDANIEIMYTILVPADNTNDAMSGTNLEKKMTFGSADAAATTITNAIKTVLTGDSTVAFMSNATPTMADSVDKKIMGTLKIKVADAKTVSADTNKTNAIKAELVKFMGINANWLTTKFMAADSDANIAIMYMVMVTADNVDETIGADALKTKMTFGSSDASAKTITDAIKTVLTGDSTVAFLSNETPIVVDAVMKKVMGTIKFKAQNAKKISETATKTTPIKGELAKFLGLAADAPQLTTTFGAADSDANVAVMYKVVVPKDNMDDTMTAEKFEIKMTFTTTDAAATTLGNAVKGVLADNTVVVVTNSAPTIMEKKSQKVVGSFKIKAANAKAVSADKSKTDKIKDELVKYLGVKPDWVTTTFAATDSDANIETKYTVTVPETNVDDSLTAEKLKEIMSFAVADAAAKKFASDIGTGLSDSTVEMISNATPTVEDASSAGGGSTTGGGGSTTTNKAKSVKGSMKFKVANPKDVKDSALKTAAIKTALAKYLGVKENWLKLTFSVVDDAAKSNMRRLADVLEVAYEVIVPADNTDANLSAEKLKEKLTFTTTDDVAKTLVSSVSTAINDNTASLASVTAPTVTETDSSTAKTSNTKATFGSISIGMVGIVVAAISV